MLTIEKFKKIEMLYWVQSESQGKWNQWYIGKNPPNENVKWRHPTYKEALQRQRIFEYEPERFEKECSISSRKMRRRVFG